MIRVHPPTTTTIRLETTVVVQRHGNMGWRGAVLNDKNERLLLTGYHMTAERAIAAAHREYADLVDFWWSACL